MPELRLQAFRLVLTQCCMLQWAHQEGIDMRILSDCNSVFISHMLTGAKVNTRVQEVVTNLSSFVRCPPPTPEASTSAQGLHESDSAHSDAESSTASPGRVQSVSSGLKTGGQSPASHCLVIQPRHDWTVSSHGCPLCPANMCKASLYHKSACCFHDNISK